MACSSFVPPIGIKRRSSKRGKLSRLKFAWKLRTATQCIPRNIILSKLIGIALSLVLFIMPFEGSSEESNRSSFYLTEDGQESPHSGLVARFPRDDGRDESILKIISVERRLRSIFGQKVALTEADRAVGKSLAEKESEEALSAKIQHGQALMVSQRYGAPCSMSTCFEHSRCLDGAPKVYIYDVDVDSMHQSVYVDLWNGFSAQKDMLTDDPDAACLFLVTINTLSRDPKHANGLVAGDPEDIERKLTSLSHWNGGRNHLILIGYVGVYPSFLPDVDFNYGSAILALSSPSKSTFRFGFDVAIPHLPVYGLSCASNTAHDVSRPILGSFVGRRHALKNSSGVIVDSGHFERASIFKMAKILMRQGIEVHESCDIVLDSCTTSFDYNRIMCSSLFSLVPRGRRLGTWRFLEAVSAGSVPVLLSRNVVLPFFEKIDWNSMVLTTTPEELDSLPGVLRNISSAELRLMQTSLQRIFAQHMATPSAIARTTLSILLERVRHHNTDEFQEQQAVYEGVGASISGLTIQTDIFPHDSELAVYQKLNETNVVLASFPVSKVSVSGPDAHREILQVAVSRFYRQYFVPCDLFASQSNTAALAGPAELSASPMYEISAVRSRRRLLELYSSWREDRLRIHGPSCGLVEVTRAQTVRVLPCGVRVGSMRRVNIVLSDGAVYLTLYRSKMKSISNRGLGDILASSFLCRSLAINSIAASLAENRVAVGSKQCDGCLHDDSQKEFMSSFDAVSCVRMLKMSGLSLSLSETLVPLEVTRR
jgi:hypothetical protein